MKIKPGEWLALPEDGRMRQLDEAAAKSARKVTVELLGGGTETISQECFDTIMIYAALDLLREQLKDACQKIRETAEIASQTAQIAREMCGEK